MIGARSLSELAYEHDASRLPKRAPSKPKVKKPVTEPSGPFLRPLTERQASILRFVLAFTEATGWPPSVREIGDQFEIKSLRGVTIHLEALESKGFIHRGPHPRQIRVRKDADGVALICRYIDAEPAKVSA